MKGGGFVLKRKIERSLRAVSKKQTSANKGGGGLMREGVWVKKSLNLCERND